MSKTKTNMTDNTNNWGINVDLVLCPECKSKQPTLRIPKNLEQLINGGWTCENCGCKMDKFGNKILESKTN
ncbi:MAG: hypothetical protein ACI8Q1_003233 [Parvicella sp.]